MADYKKNISGVSDAVKKAIRQGSAYSLPDRPSDAGMSAAEIKAALWKPICNTDAGAFSVLSEVDRIAAEAQEAVEEVRTSVGDASASLGNTIKDKVGYIGAMSGTPAGKLSYAPSGSAEPTGHFRLSDAYPSVQVSGATVTMTLEANKEYYAGALTSLTLSFPQTAEIGDYCYICFTAGTTCEMSIQTTNSTDISPTFSSGYIYEIMGKWNGSKWLLAVHESEV